MKLPIGLVAFTGASIVRAMGGSWRIDCSMVEHLEAATSGSPNKIFAHWHGRLMPLGYVHRNESIHLLASEHRDGEMLGKTMRKLGYGHVRGSSTRGGSRAIREMARKLMAGYDLGLTVDGPKGPRHVVKPGVVQLARMTGALILPLTASSRRHKTFTSWDAFELPYPFTRVRIMYGEPIAVPRDADEHMLESKRLELERTLNAITEENDRAVHE